MLMCCNYYGKWVHALYSLWQAHDKSCCLNDFLINLLFLMWENKLLFFFIQQFQVGFYFFFFFFQTLVSFQNCVCHDVDAEKYDVMQEDHLMARH